MALIVSATKEDGFTSGDDTIAPSYANEAFVIDNSTATGSDTIAHFGNRDSLLTTEKIYDSNDDGIITFGSNGVLDFFSVGGTVEIGGINPKKGLRYLGEAEEDGVTYHVYASAIVRPKGVIEGTVGDDTLDATGGDKKFFYDTALGLNLGDDLIVGFGAGDSIITTTAIFDGNGDGVINFGDDDVLALPDSDGGDVQDTTTLENGSITFDNYLADPFVLELVSAKTRGGLTYYEYAYAELA